MDLDIHIKLHARRDIKADEILDLIPDEIYMKQGYGSTRILVLEATIYPKTVYPKTG